MKSVMRRDTVKNWPQKVQDEQSVSLLTVAYIHKLVVDVVTVNFGNLYAASTSTSPSSLHSSSHICNNGNITQEIT